MPTEAEIKANYKAQHDTLSSAYYGGTSGLTKEQFDQQHGVIWDAMKQELIANGYLTEAIPPLAFSASPPGTAIGQRLTNIEDFLSERFG